MNNLFMLISSALVIAGKYGDFFRELNKHRRFTVLWFSHTRVITKHLNKNRTDNTYSYEFGKEDVLKWNYENTYLYYYTKERVMKIAYKNEDVTVYTIVNMTSLEAQVIRDTKIVAMNDFKGKTGKSEDFKSWKSTTYQLANDEVKYGTNGSEFWIKNKISELHIYNINYDLYDWTVEGNVQLNQTTKFWFEMKKNMFKLNSSLDLTIVDHLNDNDTVAFAIPLNNNMTANFITNERLNITYNPITEIFRADTFDSLTGDWLNTINLNSQQIKMTGKKKLAVKDSAMSIEFPNLNSLKITGPKGRVSLNYGVNKTAFINCKKSIRSLTVLKGATALWKMKPGNFNIEYNFFSHLTTFSINGIFNKALFMSELAPKYAIESGIALWENDLLSYLTAECKDKNYIHVYPECVNNSSVRHYDIEIHPDDKIDITYYNDDFKAISHPVRFTVDETYLEISNVLQ